MRPGETGVSREIRIKLNRRGVVRGLLGLLLLPQLGCDSQSFSAPDLVWGVHGIKPGRLHKPRVAAFDAVDHLYLADLTDRIQVFDGQGKFLTAWGRKGSGNGEFSNLHGIAVDKATGVVYVADSLNNRVLVFQPPLTNGMAATRLLGSGLVNPLGLELDPAGELWVNDSDNARYKHYTNEVLATTTFSGEHAWWIKGHVMPVVWKRRHGKGRVFYSSFGHAPETWDNRNVAQMYFEAIKWALGLTDANVTPRATPRYPKKNWVYDAFRW